jgi:hypothetical protein
MMCILCSGSDVGIELPPPPAPNPRVAVPLGDGLWDYVEPAEPQHIHAGKAIQPSV